MVGLDLILSYPYVKYFTEFNIQRGICSAICCGPKSVTQAKITRGGPILYNLYVLLPAVTEAKSFVFY